MYEELIDSSWMARGTRVGVSQQPPCPTLYNVVVRERQQQCVIMPHGVVEASFSRGGSRTNLTKGSSGKHYNLTKVRNVHYNVDRRGERSWSGLKSGRDASERRNVITSRDYL
jgi:hypothetical protein